MEDFSEFKKVNYGKSTCAQTEDLIKQGIDQIVCETCHKHDFQR